MKLVIGSKPRYVASQPSNFMKTVEEEIAANKAKNRKNEAEMEDTLNKMGEDSDEDAKGSRTTKS